MYVLKQNGEEQTEKMKITQNFIFGQNNLFIKSGFHYQMPVDSYMIKALDHW